MRTSGCGARDEERIGLVCTALERAGYGALVCARPTNVRMITGYWPVVGASVAMCTDRGAVRLIVPDDELDLARAGWADEIVTFSPGSLQAIVPLETALAPALADAVRSLDLHPSARIACEPEGVPEPASYAATYRYGAALGTLVGDALPHAEVCADHALLPRLRAVLTRAECSVLRRACRTAQRAFESAASGLTAGMWETAAADLVQSGLTGVAAGSAARAGGFAFCMAGTHAANAWAAYQQSRPVPIADGSLVLLHCNSYVDGLWTDITRTYAMAELSARNRRMYDAVFEARSAALAAVGVGATGRDVDAAARTVLQRHGFGPEYRHATGHGVGFAAIDHNAQPRLHPASTDVLAEGMVFNVEPAIYVEGYGGMRHCDVVAIVDGKAEVLTPFQAQPVIVGATHDA